MTRVSDLPQTGDAGYNPWDIGVAGLHMQQACQELSEVEQDAVYEAAVVLATVSLVRDGGLSVDDVERQFSTRSHNVEFIYDPDTDEVGVNIHFDDENAA